MNPLIWKGALGLIVSATIAGVVKLTTGTSTEIESQSIAKLLGKNRPDKRLLLEGHGAGSPEWKFTWKNYVSSFKGVDGNPLNVDTSVTGDNAPKSFMDACKKLFDEKVEGIDSNKYELALEYCTRNTLVRDLVWESGRQAISELHGNYPKWQELWEEYKRGGNELGLKNPTHPGVTREFQEKCGREASKPVSSHKDPLVSKILRYCSKPRG